MKKILTVLLVACVVFACTKDETTEVSNDSSFDFSKNLSVYDNSSDGLYKGIFSTLGSDYRGTLEIKIKDDAAIATLSLINERQIEFIGTTTDEGILFTGSSASFKFAVGSDGSNPIVTDARFNSIESSIIVAKETSRLAVTPITGSLSCDDCAAHPLMVTGPTGTFSLLYVGDGSADDIVTSMVDVGVMISTPGTQTGCTGVDPTDCTVAGGAVIGGNTIAWTGAHSYYTLGDCSEAAGTWSLASPHGAFTGTWVSDATCTVPTNDTSMTAAAISCGMTMGGDTTLASNTGAVTCGTTWTAPEVWYTYTDSGAVEDITLSTCNDTGATAGDATYDTKISVFTSPDGGVTLTCVGGNDDGAGCAGFSSLLTFTTTGDGTTVYYFIVHGFNTAVGAFNLSMDCAVPPPPAGLTCGDTYVDDGGLLGDYSVGITETTSVDATAGLVASVGFTAFDIEATWDYMYFYDGPDATAPQIMASDLGVAVSADRNGGFGFTGGDLLGDSVTGTGQFMTVVFISDASVPFPGWEGTVSCLAPAPMQENSQKFTATPKQIKAASEGDILARKKLFESFNDK